MLHNKYSKKDKLKMLELRKLGLTYAVIGKRFGMSADMVRKYCYIEAKRAKDTQST